MEPEVNKNNIASPYDPYERLGRLIRLGNSVEVDMKIPVRRYYRSALEMVRMADSYYKDGNLENAFILYLKFVVLFVEKLRKHPKMHEVPVVERAYNNRKIRSSLDLSNMIKEKLLERYKMEHDNWLKLQGNLSSNSGEECSDEACANGGESSSGACHLKVDNANSPDTYSSSVTDSDCDLEYQLLSNQSRLNVSEDSCSSSDSAISQNSETSAAYVMRSLSEFILPDMDSLSLNTYESPDVPPKIDRSTKPLSLLTPLQFDSTTGMRNIIVPVKLIAKFLSLASENTNINIETCGLLAGKLTCNKLIVTHLIVPKQTGTSDSCTTSSEEEIFSLQDEHDLITIGWIHTHPSQTAFLSSVDLHTHCSYQLLLPEAIAIVCATRYDKLGIYALTAEGLRTIAKCHTNVGFHPHQNEKSLYYEGDHITFEENRVLNVIDLRKLHHH